MFSKAVVLALMGIAIASPPADWQKKSESTGGQEPPSRAAESLFRTLIPRPTGRNGYEQYLQAADVVAGSEFVAYMRWRARRLSETKSGTQWKDDDNQPIAPLQTPFGLPSDSSLLDVDREAARRFANVLELVKVGNFKTVYHPRDKVSVFTAMPELQRFRDVARFLSYVARVRFADGATSGGTDALLQGIRFGINVRCQSLLHDLVGIANTAIALAAFEENLDRLSEQDAARIEAFASAELKRPWPFADTLDRELAWLLDIVEEHLQPGKLKDAVQILGLDESDASTVAAQIEKLSEAEAAEVRETIKRKLSSFMAPISKRFRGPESGWFIPGETDPFYDGVPATAGKVETISHMFLAVLTPSMKNAIGAELRNRTQLRLLNAHAQIIRYRWRHDVVPRKATAAVKPSDLVDPFGGGDYQYERLDSLRYRLYCRGFGDVGEIELRYKPKRSPADRDPNDPPIQWP